MDKTQINDQDFFTVISYISGNTIGTQLAWDFIRTNWLAIVKRFTLNDRRLGGMITNVCSKFTTSLQLTEMEEFFKKYPDAGAGKNARMQALEKVKSSISWLNQHSKTIEIWLQKNTASSQPWLDWRLNSVSN
jgi:glutamyl aminopeptidase